MEQWMNQCIGMGDDYWGNYYFEGQPSPWFNENGMPTTPIGLYGVTRRFAMGSERWDYYYALHLEKINKDYDPYCPINEWWEPNNEIITTDKPSVLKNFKWDWLNK